MHLSNTFPGLADSRFVLPSPPPYRSVNCDATDARVTRLITCQPGFPKPDRLTEDMVVHELDSDTVLARGETRASALTVCIQSLLLARGVGKGAEVGVGLLYCWSLPVLSQNSPTLIQRTSPPPTPLSGPSTPPLIPSSKLILHNFIPCDELF